MKPIIPTLKLTSLVLVACNFALLAFAIDSHDETYLTGLRERRLHQLAASYIERQLQQQDVSPADQAQLTAELIRVQAARAAMAPPGEARDTLWQQAEKTAAEFGRLRNLRPGDRLLVEVQAGLTPLARGELLRQEWEAGVGGENTRLNSLQAIREAAKLLTEIEKTLARQIAAGDEDDGLSQQQRVSLAVNVRYQLARSMRNRALCYPPEDASRVDALNQAVASLDSLLRELAAADPLVWKTHLDRAACLRLLGDNTKAANELANIATLDPPFEIRLQTTAEAARLALAQNKPAQAEAILTKFVEAVGQSPDFDFAFLQTYVALWKDATAKQNEQAVSNYRTRSKATVALIENRHGPYWRRRADRALIEAAGETGVSGDYELLARTADRLYQRGEFEEAIASYANAAQKLLKAGDAKGTFKLFYKAALVEHQRKSHARAATRFMLAATSVPQDPQAPQAQLLAAFNYSRLDIKDPKTLPRYAATLEELIATWPQSAAADTARLWLAKLRRGERSWGEAIDLLLAVSNQANEYAEAIALAAEISTSWMNDLQATGEPTSEKAENLAKYFEEIVISDKGEPPADWNAINRQAILTAARLRVQHDAGDSRHNIALLENALAKSPDAAPGWKSQARSLLVVALAGTPGRAVDSQKMLSALADNRPEQLLEILNDLTELAQNAQGAAKREIGNLQLQSIGMLKPKLAELEKTAQLKLQLAEAHALEIVGKRSQGKTRFAAIAKAHPRNGVIQKQYAEFLSRGESDLSAALDQWRRVAAGSRPKTETWWLAKYNVAFTQYRLGKKQEAVSLIRYLQATPPGLKATNLRPAFEKLLSDAAK